MPNEVVAFRGRSRKAPILENRKVLIRPRNSELRTREYLTPDEVGELEKAARQTGRHGHRDATLILVAFRHGLRASELIALRWDQVDLKAGKLHVNRLKNGSSPSIPFEGRSYGR